MQAIWNKYNRSSKSGNAVKQACGRAIKVPGETRWNSKWDAINVLLEINSHKKLNDVCRSLELPTFKQSEVDFLIEWARINRPLTTTLDMLQGDKESYYGMLLPRLSVLVFDLTKLYETVSGVTKLLVTAILEGVKNRFPMLDFQRPQSQRAILAAVSNPMYKLRWVPVNQKNEVQHIFIKGLRRAHEENLRHIHEENLRRIHEENLHPQQRNTDTATSSSGCASEVDEFYMFQTPSDDDNSSLAAVNVEAANYLADGSKQLSMLQSYPTVQQLFF